VVTDHPAEPVRALLEVFKAEFEVLRVRFRFLALHDVDVLFFVAQRTESPLYILSACHILARRSTTACAKASRAAPATAATTTATTAARPETDAPDSVRFVATTATRWLPAPAAMERVIALTATPSRHDGWLQRAPAARLLRLAQRPAPPLWTNLAVVEKARLRDGRLWRGFSVTLPLQKPGNRFPKSCRPCPK
jgi:hypothetical protein